MPPPRIFTKEQLKIRKRLLAKLSYHDLKRNNYCIQCRLTPSIKYARCVKCRAIQAKARKKKYNPRATNSKKARWKRRIYSLAMKKYHANKQRASNQTLPAGEQ